MTCDIQTCEGDGCNTESEKTKEDMGVAVSTYILFYFSINIFDTIVTKLLITIKLQSSSSEANIRGKDSKRDCAWVLY